MDIRDISEVHRTKGKICTYTLELENGKWWTGYSTDVEKRIAQHCQKCPGGAKWTALHKPKRLAEIKLHDSISEALAAETANWNLLAALHGENNVRGGRYNLCEDLKYPPRGWREKREKEASEEKKCPKA